METIKKLVTKACLDEFNLEIAPEITRPEEKFGDFSTNVALTLAKQLEAQPHEIAKKLVARLESAGEIAKVEVAGPGFINFWLSDEALADAAIKATELPQPLKDQEILVEFGDPNPFKEMHIGHLYSYIVGDSIARLLEASGATVRRLSYHGDVGLHVAKAIWGMKNSGIDFDKEDNVDSNIGDFYAKGSEAYSKDEQVANQINVINELIYSKEDPSINKLYDWGRERSFAYFDQLLQGLGIGNDRRYLESQSADIGMAFVRQQTGPVFKESDGAIIYEGEKVGLHTRVFITSKGLPTYEAKDLGLAELKKQDYPEALRSIIITAHEQSEYFKVMLAALTEFDKDLADKTTHLAHGFLSLSTGKMSSRTGEVYSAVSLLDDVKTEAEKHHPSSTPDIHLGAIKYGFLKHRLGTDITYNVQESVSLEGNSGPYLQYALVRASSIIKKAAEQSPNKLDQIKLEPPERSLVRMISLYPEVVVQAVDELMPHHITTYLYELAQQFNRFYEKCRIIGDERETLRLQIVHAYAAVLKHGLKTLNVPAVEQM